MRSLSMLAVHTPIFDGPLDLLLHLIEREDLDITTVSLIQVTDQYLAALHAADSIDMKALADFVAVGARLLLLKSRALLPRSAEQLSEDALEAEEIAQDLTAQLEEYRSFKMAAGYLKDLEEAGHRSFARVSPPPAEWLPSGLEKITLKKLLKALNQALQRLPAAAPEPEPLQRAVVSIIARRQAVLDAVRRGHGRASFSRLISECRTRLEAVVTFLAVLDLIKSESVTAEQDASFGDIVLTGSIHSRHSTASV